MLLHTTAHKRNTSAHIKSRFVLQLNHGERKNARFTSPSAVFQREDVIGMVAYEQRLEWLGYAPECARRIVDDFTSTGKLKDLVDYINYKESEKRSINEHVTEVLG